LVPINLCISIETYIDIGIKLLSKPKYTSISIM
jgi:hypothetical protein